MKAIDLLNVIGEVDDELIANAKKNQKSCKKRIISIGSIAACAVFACAGIFALSNFWNNGITQQFNGGNYTGGVAVNSGVSNAIDNSDVGMIRDLSVDLEKSYSVPDSDSNVLEVVSTANEFYSDDLKELISVSDDVIRVKVQNVTFTSYEGVAWTKADVLVTDSFKGDLKIGDVISVFTLGGYIPLSDHIEGHNDAFRFNDLSAEEIKKTFLKETIDGEKMIEKSEDLILCVVKTPEDSPLPNGAYERISYSGQLYAKNNEKFVQMITDSSGETEKIYSCDDIRKMIEED